MWSCFLRLFYTPCALVSFRRLSSGTRAGMLGWYPRVCHTHLTVLNQKREGFARANPEGAQAMPFHQPCSFPRSDPSVLVPALLTRLFCCAGENSLCWAGLSHEDRVRVGEQEAVEEDSAPQKGGCGTAEHPKCLHGEGKVLCWCCAPLRK